MTEFTDAHEPDLQPAEKDVQVSCKPTLVVVGSTIALVRGGSGPFFDFLGLSRLA